ncbi:MSCRAMM family protein [Ruminococcus flavefaciens]|uniref:MSCRAMM family protein n=1 Tax=Ruminococcus flavefaciens TaxID=1265 RepID=UPI000A759802|nr:SpaA isopeptide-forming pilin-related protein [Ruminococcus flavefaciens]
MDFDVDAEGNIIKAYVNGIAVSDDELADDFEFIEIDTDDKVYTVVYNGTSVKPVNGYYELDGDRYSIEINENDGTINSVIKLGNELDPSGFSFVEDELYYDSSLSPLTENDDGTFTYNDKKIIVTVNNDTERTITAVRYADEEADASIKDAIQPVSANYIVKYKGDVASTVLNISCSLKTKLEFIDEQAFTVNKVDSKGVPLIGANIGFVEEIYTYNGASIHIYSKMPKDGEIAKSVSSWKWDSAETVKATFRSSDMELALPYAVNASDKLKVYRIIETEAPEGYDITSSDIVIIKGYADDKEVFYKRSIAHGEPIRDLPFEIDAAENGYRLGDEKANTGEWEKINADSPSGRVINIVNKNDECRIRIAKVDQDNNFISGAVLQIFKEDDKTPYIDNIRPDMTGSVGLSKSFAPGTYYIVEKYAPDNCSKEREGVKQYFTVTEELTPILGRNAFEMGIGRDLDGGKHRYSVDDSNGNTLISYDNFDGTIGYANVKKIIASMTAAPSNVEYKINSSAPTGAHVSGGKFQDEMCSFVYDDASKTATITFKEAVDINNLLFAKYDGVFEVTDVKFITDGIADSAEYEWLSLDNTSGANVISFINEVIEVKNDVTFRKINDTTHIEETTGSEYNVESNDERVLDAQLKLTLVEPEKTDADLLGVTSNFEGKEFSEGNPDISETEILWETVEEDLKLYGLPNGKYELSEVYAPDGHQKIKKTELSIFNGEVTSDNPEYVFTANKSDWEDASVTAVDELFTVTVRKTSKSNDSVEIPVVGAKLRLTGVSDGIPTDMSNVRAKNEVFFREDGSSIQPGIADAKLSPYKLDINNIQNVAEDPSTAFEFYSTGDTVIFTGLPCGEYKLEEVETPLGMSTADSRVFYVDLEDDEDGNERLVLKGGDEGTTENVITLYDDIHTVKISKADIGRNIIEGAEFELSRLDGKALDNISVVGTNDNAKSRIKAFVDDNYDIEDNNDKSVEITLDGNQSFTLSGKTLNHITVNDEWINYITEQNVYTYSGTAEDKLVICGMYDGIYVVTLDDGTEYTIRCDKGNEEITQIDAKIKPKTTDDKAVLNENTAILSTDKTTLSFTGGSVDISSLADGEYVLRETASPNGYTKVESEFVFVVENGKVSVNEAYTTGASVKNGNEIIIKDDVSEIDFYKFYDVEENTTPDDTHEGAEMKLTFKKASDKAATVIEGADTLEVGESVTWNTNDENPKTLRGLMDGEYILEEVKAPTIYEKAEPRTIYIENGAVALKNGDRTIGTRPYTHLLNVKKGSIVIDKKALGAKEIPEEAGKAKFTLIANDEGTDLKGIVVNSSEITESTDRITFDGNTVTLIGLADGEYTLIEDTAPIGYSVVSEFTFVIKGGMIFGVEAVSNGRTYVDDKVVDSNGRAIGFMTMVIEDAPIITIDKKALGAKEIPEESGHAEFTLTAMNENRNLTGVVIGEGEDAIRVENGAKSVSFEGNSAKFTGLKDGAYKLVEDTAPLGYSVISEFTFEIKDGLVENVQTVTNGRTYTEDDGKTLVVEDDHLKYINNISLTLSDTLGLNFYLNESIPAYEAADYKVLLTGNCLENGQMVEFTEKNGKYCVTAHVYAKDLNEKIVAEVVKKDKVIYTSEPYSVSDYLESALKTVTEPEALTLIKATIVFGSASADYFYEGDHGFAESLEAYLKQTDISEDDLIRLGMLDQYAPNFDSNEAKISLVLDSRTAIRLYIKGVAAKTKSGSLISEASTKVNKTTYPSYFEITEITPDQLAKNYTITLKDKNYSLSALSWVYRVMNNYISDEDSVSDKNLKMAKAITAYYIAANEYVNADHATTS